MSEIEKMMQNANVKKDWNSTPYGGIEEYYPPFTAEKQIEITRKLWEFRPNIYPNFDLLVNHSYSEMIATFVNNHWQSLTEEEKQQIKEILE
jgi:hypothetical protein